MHLYNSTFEFLNVKLAMKKMRIFLLFITGLRASLVDKLSSRIKLVFIVTLSAVQSITIESVTGPIN